jgi:hypothetical protein
MGTGDSSSGVKRPERGADHSPATSTVVKKRKRGSIYPIPYICKMSTCYRSRWSRFCSYDFLIYFAASQLGGCDSPQCTFLCTTWFATFHSSRPLCAVWKYAWHLLHCSLLCVYMTQILVHGECSSSPPTHIIFWTMPAYKHSASGRTVLARTSSNLLLCYTMDRSEGVNFRNECAAIEDFNFWQSKQTHLYGFAKENVRTYKVRQFNSRNGRSVSLGCWVTQTHVPKHVWTCSILRLYEPHTKWFVRSQTAEEEVRVRGTLAPPLIFLLLYPNFYLFIEPWSREEQRFVTGSIAVITTSPR